MLITELREQLRLYRYLFVHKQEKKPTHSFSDKSIAVKGLDGGDSLDGVSLDGNSLEMESSSKELLENDSLSST